MRVQEHVLAFQDCCLSVFESQPRVAASRLVPVFLHGRFGDSSLWRESLVFHRARRHYRCLLVDLPGYGRSFAAGGPSLELSQLGDLLTEFLRTRIAPGEAPVLIAHDLGAVVAQLASLAAPVVLAGLVLTGARCLFDEAVPVRLPAYRRWRLLRASPGLSPDHRARIRQSNLPLTFLRGLEESWPGRHERCALADRARALSLPTLLLWGRQDGFSPPSHGFRLANAYSDSRYLEHEQGGHWAFLDQGEWFGSKVAEFLFHLDLVSSVRWGKSV